MRRSLNDLLACPSCRVAYRLCAHEERDEEVLYGYLQCPTCAIVVPIVEGFAFFTEPLLHSGQASRPALESLGAKWFGARDSYLEYRRTKVERGVWESYAAFHPFNESTRAFDTVVPLIEAQLTAGDFILDPWCRTGWSAESLAARFPEQRIVGLWEGDRSVLGYRGFRHWLGFALRSRNLDILFAHPERGLPFRNGCFAAIHAADCFHRFSLHGFAGECLRVSKPNAPIALAHLHLTNSEPDPWFDRGGTLFHGRDYRAWLDRVLSDGSRRGFVWSERDLFQAAPLASPAPDTPDTDHYNGFVMLIRPNQLAAPQSSSRLIPERTRLLVNPLFRLYIGERLARVERALHDGMVGALMDRHPCYRERLSKRGLRLGEEAIALLALAVTGHTLHACARALDCTTDQIEEALQPLIAGELVMPVLASKQTFDLQRFHSNQIPAVEQQIPLEAFFATLGEAGRQKDVCIRDGSGCAINGSEMRALTESAAAALSRLGLAGESELALDVGSHPLGLILILAGISLGVHVTLMDDKANGPRHGRLRKWDLLIHHDGSAPAIDSAGRCMALGIDAGAGTFVHQLKSSSGGPLTVVRGGRLRSQLGKGGVSVEGAVLIEAADSLQSAVLQASAELDGPWSLGNVLAALVALSLGEGILCRG